MKRQELMDFYLSFAILTERENYVLNNINSLSKKWKGKRSWEGSEESNQIKYNGRVLYKEEGKE